jgi:hypothetical protein
MCIFCMKSQCKLSLQQLIGRTKKRINIKSAKKTLYVETPTANKNAMNHKLHHLYFEPLDASTFA